jgi:hypothetical protein
MLTISLTMKSLVVGIRLALRLAGLICIVGPVLPQVRLKQEPQGQPQEQEPPPELVLDYRLAGQLSLVWRAH